MKPLLSTLPKIEHLEYDEFGIRLFNGKLKISSIGSENCYATDENKKEFYAKFVNQDAIDFGLRDFSETEKNTVYGGTGR